MRLLCAAGYNIRWLMLMIRKKGIRLFLCLIGMLGLGGLPYGIASLTDPIKELL